MSNVLAAHGARLADHGGPAVHYGSGMGTRHFDWADAAHLYPSQLADRFLAEFQNVAQLGWGRDWMYAGWYVEMLGRTYPAGLPIAEADYPLPTDQLMAVGGTAPVFIPLPPGGESRRVGPEVGEGH